MKNAVYCRVSTDMQDKGLDAQKRSVLSFCKQKGYSRDELLIYEDCSTGSNTNRNELHRLRKDIATGKIQGVYVYSISRLSRSLKDLLGLLDLFDTHNVHFESVTESFNLRSPFGRLLVSILGSLGQMEREILSERTKNGLRAAKERGTKLGAKKRVNTELIIQLKKQNLTHRQIAEIADCSASTVCVELKKFNIGPISKQT